MFSPDTPPDQRAAAIRHAVKLAMAGDGRAAFDLGVLYRHGMSHPARAVERDVETARYWLEKCVESRHCPVFSLASLAELELAAGQDKAAMQWAQAWASVQRELGRRDPKAGLRARDGAYEAYLLTRCFDHMANKDRDRVATGWFAELLATRGKQLDRMVAEQSEPPKDDRNTRPVLEALRNGSVNAPARLPPKPALALFLLRAAPSGGRPEAAFLLEALPSPATARGLDTIANRFGIKAYVPDPPASRAYAFVPVSYDDRRYSLLPHEEEWVRRRGAGSGLVRKSQ